MSTVDEFTKAFVREAGKEAFSSESAEAQLFAFRAAQHMYLSETEASASHLHLAMARGFARRAKREARGC